MDPDVLIVGSGLAGLSFGALMANSGRRVRIVEAHDKPGGYAHTFVEGGKYRFNAQLHYVWNCGPGETVHRFQGLLAHLATLTKNTIQPAGDLPSFDRLTVPTPLQQKGFDLLGVSIPV